MGIGGGGAWIGRDRGKQGDGFVWGGGGEVEVDGAVVIGEGT